MRRAFDLLLALFGLTVGPPLLLTFLVRAIWTRDFPLPESFVSECLVAPASMPRFA